MIRGVIRGMAKGRSKALKKGGINLWRKGRKALQMEEW